MINIIYGSPGCGKTTYLIDKVEQWISGGILATDIMFISFTRKAANEAKDRAAKRLGLNELQLQWFRTLHGLAFHQLGLGKENVMNIKDYFKICSELGMYITNKGFGEDGNFSGQTRGDRLLFMENMARTMMVDLKEYWNKFPDEDIEWFELDLIHRTIEEYKQLTGKRDFTDLVHQYCESPIIPEIKILFIDEAQDLSPLQWRMAKILIENCGEVYIAGDDDQSIFRWAGADTEQFINLEGNKHILPQSYRVPQSIQIVAESIISKIVHRVKKDWRARDDIGRVDHINDFDEIDLSSETWLLMSRNIHQLDLFTYHCILNGYLFEGDRSPIRQSVYRAIISWNKLLKDEKITVDAVKNLYDLISSNPGIARGFKKNIDMMSSQQTYSFEDLKNSFGLLLDRISWDRALDRITDEEREYHLAAERRGEDLTSKPRIKIATIHSSKGGEADNVILLTDMAPRTWDEYQLNPDDEHRVWYVAVTRARRSLYVMIPKTNMYYDIPFNPIVNSLMSR